MKIRRRQFLHLAAGAAAAPAFSRIARAQTYPTRPVRIIVGFAAGGGQDISTRLLGQWLSERLGQQFIIENRPGAGSNVATEAVAHSSPDGYTLLRVGSPNAFNATLYNKLNFNFLRDIAPVASVMHVPLIMVVHPLFPAKTTAEFIAFAKSNPGKINMASGGSGSSQHVAGELFKTMAGVNMVHVPYRGSAPALTDLMGGQVHVMFDTVPSSIEYVRGGRLRALATTTMTRLEVLPDLPTVSEFVTGYEATAWAGVGAPKNTPTDIVNQLNREINAILADPRAKTRLADLGGIPLNMAPADFGKFMADETEKWGKVIRAANIKAE